MPLIGAQGPGSNISWRGNLDEYPDSFSFTEVLDIFPGTAATCSPTTITGINYKALVTAVGSAASVRVTPYDDTTDTYGPVGPFLPGNDANNPVIIRNKDKIEIQVITQSPQAIGRDAFNATYNVNIDIGKRGPVGWFAKTQELDDDPDPFDFEDLSNLEINTLTNSDVVTVTGIDDIIGVDIFIVSGSGEFQLNSSGNWVQSAKIFDGDILQLRNTTSNFYSTPVETIIQLGIFQANWNIQTRPADTTINSFTFTDVVDVDINTINESNSITISGADENLNGNNPLPLTFSGNGQYRILDGNTVIQDYTDLASSTCSNGNTIQLKQTASGDYSTKTDATLTVSNQSDTYSVTTRPRPIDTIPDPFTFTDKTGVLRNELITSNVITLTGMTAFGDEGTATISGSSGADAKFRVTRNGTVVHDWSSSSFGVQLADQIELRVLSATASLGSVSATFTIAGTNTFEEISGIDGSQSDTWNVTSKARDCGITDFVLPNIPEASSTLKPNDVAKVEFTVGGAFEFDCNVTATTSNTNSYLKKKGTNQQGTSLSDVKQGDIIEVYMTTPYYCSSRTTNVQLKAAFATSGSEQDASWTISPKAPDKPKLTLGATNLAPPFIFPDGGSTTILYEYTDVTVSSVTATGPGGFSSLSTVPVSTSGSPTKSGSKAVSNLANGTSTFTLTVSNCTGSTTDQINVITGTPPSPTLFFCVNKPNPNSSCPSTFNISRFNSATLYWASNNAIKVEAIAGTGFNTGDKQSGNDSVTPVDDGEVYTAKATGAGSSPQTVSKSITFKFKPSVSLSVSPSNVITGNNVTLTWQATDADLVTSSSGKSFSNITALSGSKVINMDADGTFTWSITVKDNGTGESVTSNASAKVTDDTTVANFNMNPSSKTGVKRGSQQESQPKFTSGNSNKVSGLSPGVSVTAKVSGGGAKFLNNTTSKTVSNGTNCSALRVKMNASNSYNTTKTCTLNIGGVSKNFSVKSEQCVVNNGSYNIDGCSFNTREFKSSNGVFNGSKGIISFSGGCSGQTGGKRSQVTTGSVDRYSNQQNSTFTLPTGTSSVEAKGVGGGGGAGCDKDDNGIGAGGGGGGGAFKVEWNKAEGGDVVTFYAGKGGNGKSGNNGSGNSGQTSFIKINGPQNAKASAGGGGGGDEKEGGGGGFSQGSGGKGKGGGSRRGDEGGHGGGAGRVNGGACENGAAEPGSQPGDQGGPGRGSTLSGGCKGNKKQEKGTMEGANGHSYGGGASSGGYGNGGGSGAPGFTSIKYTVSWKQYNKTTVFKKIGEAYWNKKNRPPSGSELKYWYNQFKDNPATYPTISKLYDKINPSGGKANNPTDNCGNSYPKFK